MTRTQRILELIATGIVVAGVTTVVVTNPGRPNEKTEVTDTVHGAHEVTGPAKAALVTAMAESASTGEITCTRGVIANYPNRVYCTDGKTAGFLLPPGVAAQLEAETSANLPDIKSPGATELALDGDKLFLSVEGQRGRQ